jgi:glycosyltransferase involved in cell wall biosynthesis
MKTRVAFLSVVPSPYQRDIFAALIARPDIDLQVYYLEAAAPDSPWPQKPLPPCSRILPGFWFPIGSARCHINLLPDLRDREIIVLNTLMSVTAQLLMRTTLRKIPWVFWGERLAQRPPNKRDTLHNLLTSPLHDAAAIAGIGSLATTQYTARFPIPRHYNIPYHCDLAPFLSQPRPERDPAQLTYLFCGQMIPRKGLDHLLTAFTALHSKYPHTRLLLTGREASLPTLLNSVPAPTRARIEYTGFQPPESLPAIFARADIFILPSRYDGWGVVVNQALAAGLPLICSDAVGAAHDLIDPDKNGLLFPPGDIPALTNAMEKFAAIPDLAKEYGAASRLKTPNWTPARGAEKWSALFREVLNSKK